MSTRGLIKVIQASQTKIAQYQQNGFDPETTGTAVLKLLKTHGFVTKLTTQVARLSAWTDNDYRKLYRTYGIDISDTDTPELLGVLQQFDIFRNDLPTQIAKDHPALDRYTGYKILQLVANGEVIKVELQEDFQLAPTCCGVIIINLDTNKFAWVDSDHKIVYDLDKLPTEKQFLQTYKGDKQ